MGIQADDSMNEGIAALNYYFFQNIELTEDENKVLCWLCRWDEYTVSNIISAFLKII
jgi:hypothetical protein